MSGKLTLRMVATLLLLTGLGWVTGTLPWPVGGDTPPLQSASQPSPRAENPVVAADLSSAPVSRESFNQAEYLLVDAADDDSLGALDDESLDDELVADDEGQLSVDIHTSDLPIA